MIYKTELIDYVKCEPFTSYFDIETTGLSKNYNNIITYSIVTYFNEKSSKVICCALENINEEKELVNRLLEDLIGMKNIVTYNGNRFDIPFVFTRAKKHLDFFKPELFKFNSIDLLNITKAFKPYWNLNSTRQIHIEEFFNINRLDKIASEDISDKFDFKNDEIDTKYIENVLHHNKLDVINLNKIHSSILKKQMENSFQLNDIKTCINYFKFSKNTTYIKFIGQESFVNLLSEYYCNDGSYIKVRKENIEIDLITTEYKEDNNKMILYPLEDGSYLCLFDDKTIYYENIFYILDLLIKEN